MYFNLHVWGSLVVRKKWPCDVYMVILVIAWGCFLGPVAFSTTLLHLKWWLLVQLHNTHISIISLVMRATLYHRVCLNDSSPPWQMTCGTPKLTQAQFHTFIIDHYIIKQEVTTTVSVQQFLIASADSPSCNCCGAPTGGTVLLQSLHYCKAPSSPDAGQGNTEACRASIQNWFGHINFIFFHKESWRVWVLHGKIRFCNFHNSKIQVYLFFSVYKCYQHKQNF